MKNIYSIKDKVIVVTGATGYLGSKMVEHLSLAGAKVMVLSTKLIRAQEMCEKLGLSMDYAFEVDISDKDSLEKVYKNINDKFGKIDVLVNNAFFGVTKTFDAYSKDDWIKSLEGTIISIDLSTQAMLKYMKNQKHSRIINISSMYGMLSPNPDIYPSKDMINPLSYGTGKAAIIQYTRYMAMSLAEYNITVNTVSYGPFPNINLVDDKKFIDNLSDKTMLKRVGNSDEVTSAIYFLSLDESSYITGQNIIVDGGWTSW